MTLHVDLDDCWRLGCTEFTLYRQAAAHQVALLIPHALHILLPAFGAIHF